jgi:CBS domain-containing protein
MPDQAARLRANATYRRLRKASRRLAFSVLAGAVIAGAAGRFLGTAGLLVLSALFAVGAERAEAALESLAGVSTVGDVMAAPVITVPAALSLIEVERQFLASWPYGVFPVMRGEQPVGVLRRQDAFRVPAHERGRLSVQAVMIRLHPRLVARSTDSLEAALTRLDRRVGCIVVIDDGQLRGLLTRAARYGPPWPRGFARA